MIVSSGHFDYRASQNLPQLRMLLPVLHIEHVLSGTHIAINVHFGFVCMTVVDRGQC